MNKPVQAIITDTTITFVSKKCQTKDGKSTFTVRTDSPVASDLIKALNAGDEETAVRLASEAERMKALSGGKATIDSQTGVVYYNGAPVHNGIQERVNQLFTSKRSYEPLLRLLEKVYLNPSPRAIDEIFPFLEAKGLPITPTGNFIGYKVVILRDGHLWDCRTGEIRNDISDKPYMERGETDDWGIECGEGFHVGNLSYAGPHGWFYRDNKSPHKRIVLVEVNPKDVVSVPRHESSKLRCNTYEVIGMCSQELTDPIYGEVKETSQVPVSEVLKQAREVAKKARTSKRTTERKMRTIKYPETWKEYIYRLLAENEPIYLGSLYNLVKRPGKNVKAKVRQVLQQIAKKDNNGNWIRK